MRPKAILRGGHGHLLLVTEVRDSQIDQIPVLDCEALDGVLDDDVTVGLQSTLLGEVPGFVCV